MDPNVLNAAREAIAEFAAEMESSIGRGISRNTVARRLREMQVGIEAATAAEAAPSDAEIVEALADLEHEQWMAWSKDIAKKEPLSTARFDRWSAYWVPYADLENDVKEHDRKWARKALEIVRRARQPQPADELFLSSQVAKMRAERDRAVEALLNNKLASAVHACRECDGTGAVTCTGPTGEFSDQWQEPCPECSVDEKDELQIERERHAEVIDDLQRKIRVVAKERERAEQAETERDAARKALRGLVELAKAVKAEDDYLEKTEHHDNYTDRSRSWARQAKATRDLVDATLRTAREVLDG